MNVFEFLWSKFKKKLLKINGESRNRYYKNKWNYRFPVIKLDDFIIITEVIK